MTLITRTVKRRELEDDLRLKKDLRKVREVARTVEADHEEETELDMATRVIPLKELNDFLEARQLREERRQVREDAEFALTRGVAGTGTLLDAMEREHFLQNSLAINKSRANLDELRREARRIRKDMAELTDGTNIFGQLQEMRRQIQ